MTTIVLVLARTLHIGSAMLLFALLYFVLVILGASFTADKKESDPLFWRKIIKGLWLALILEAVSGGVWFWFVTAQMVEKSPWGLLDVADLSTVLGQTQFGQLWLGRLAMGVVLGGLLYFASPGSSFWNGLMLVLGTGLLISLAWAGHAAAGIHHRGLHLFADVLHLLIGAIWPMGLIPLACFLGQSNGGKRFSPAEAETTVLQRFSQTSLIAVLILVVTGSINGWLMVGSWEALVTTVYGRLLLGKVLIVGVMIALGAYNRLCLLPRRQEGSILFSALRKTVLVESGLALVVLLIVGMMGMTSPPS